MEGSRRSKREVKKTAAAETLEKLKRAKGTGERVEATITEEKGLFDYVDEKEYRKIVRKRQADSWVVEDGNSAYFDDGRELFEQENSSEDDEEEGGGGSGEAKGKEKGQPQKKKKKHADKKSIRSMLLMTKPKDEKDVTLEGDAALEECLQEWDAVKFSNPKANKRREVKFRNFDRPSPMSTREPSAAGQLPRQSGAGFTPMRERPMLTVEKGKTSKWSNDAAMTTTTEKNGSDVAEGTTSSGPSNPPLQEENLEKSELQDLDNFEIDMADFESMDVIEGEGQPDPSTTVKEKEKEEDDDILTKGRLWEEGWETVKSQKEEEAPVLVVDPTQLPISEVEGHPTLQFYWLDAYEEQHSQPGTVFLFGKVKLPDQSAYASCCVQVKNIERCLYFLPRRKMLDKKQEIELDQEVKMEDVYQEFNKTFAEPFKIMRFTSKRVDKKYAFEKTDVPSSVEYLEVKYSAKHRPPPMDSSGRSFSHVFGSNTSSVERLLLSQQIKGPCWLNIKQPAPGEGISWCKFECSVSSHSSVSIMPEQPPLPPLVIASINIKTLLNPKSGSHEVLMAGVFVNTSFQLDKPPETSWKRSYHSQFCGVRKMADRNFPYDFKKDKLGGFVEVLPTERALLAFLLAKLHKIDPDVILGHGLQDFHLDTLARRVQANKVPNWSRLGRLKRSAVVKGKMLTQQIVTGRPVCDVKISSKELIRARSYDLTELVKQVLRAAYPEVTVEETVQAYESTAKLTSLLHHCMDGALAAIGIMMELNILPLSFQITKIAGNVLSRTLMGGRSERNEFLLLHAFTSRGYICPDKTFGGAKRGVSSAGGGESEPGGGEESGGKASSGRRKPAYAGGLVLEPKKGFYDTFILLLDFNSLYPSIIQEYNIDFTTVEGWQLAMAAGDSTTGGTAAVILDPPSDSVEPGVLPSEIRILVNRRREVKAMMRGQPPGSHLHQQYDIRQKALKLTANSMYGCLGFSHSRFYAQPLAALITSRGREILSHTRDLVEKMGLEVIYGDTDSIMINTNSKDFAAVMELAGKVKAEVNKFYRLLEIDVDGVYKTMLLLKKKKYAAMCMTPGSGGSSPVLSMEMKGLDIVRRDWCNLAKETGQWVLERILTCEDREEMLDKIHEHLAQVADDVGGGRVRLDKFVITKSLSKAPGQYADAKSLPHVLVASRMASKGSRFQAGDVVPYIVCRHTSATDESQTLPAAQRALHPIELRKSTDQIVDTNYYLQQQVHAVVARLCEPIHGTDSAQIAHHLGLDPAHFRSGLRSNDDGAGEDFLLLSKESWNERSKNCQPLQFACPQCQGQMLHREKYVRVCQHCKQPFDEEYACKQMEALVQEHINQYDMGWMCCDDQTCAFRVQDPPTPGVNHAPSPECYMCGQGHLKREYTAKMVYDQICYFKHILTESKEILKTRAYEVELMDWLLSKNEYSKIDLDRLFGGLGV